MIPVRWHRGEVMMAEPKNEHMRVGRRIGLIALAIPLLVIGMTALFGAALSFRLYNHRLVLSIASMLMLGLGAFFFLVLGGGLVRAAIFTDR